MSFPWPAFGSLATLLRVVFVGPEVASAADPLHAPAADAVRGVGVRAQDEVPLRSMCALEHCALRLGPRRTLIGKELVAGL